MSIYDAKPWLSRYDQRVFAAVDLVKCAGPPP
jgi:hypothetical protein